MKQRRKLNVGITSQGGNNALASMKVHVHIHFHVNLYNTLSRFIFFVQCVDKSARTLYAGQLTGSRASGGEQAVS